MSSENGAGRSPVFLSRQNEIYDLAIAIVKSLIAEQPSVTIDEKRTTVSSGNYDVVVLANLPELAFEAVVRIKITYHRSL